MESSEDDAGTATNASRRVSAREKDVGLAEDVNATSSSQQKSSEAQISCQTPAMSEDTFDGDGVPSPSSQDVNTSTEAILDMIDEIVDGPDAPKRLQQTSKIVDALNEELATTSYNLNIIQEATNSDENRSLSPHEMKHVSNIIAYGDTLLSVEREKITECPTLSDVSVIHDVREVVDVLAATSTAESNDIVVPKKHISEVGQGNSSSSFSFPNIPSSSEEQVNKTVSERVCETQDRTIKCVSSSDNRDNVTVESAESTSSDSSVSESKALHIAPQIRSPLRRRLVRPVPSDRRPDYTVSSTVDSQTVNIASAECTTSSENVTKDVTSSSDAVPIIHGNVKPEEISNVSEISFCQAETTISPPKKIKLNRQKSVTGISSREDSLNPISICPEKNVCQSTSTDAHSLHLPILTTESTSTINSSQSQDNSESHILDTNCMSRKLLVDHIESDDKLCPSEHSQSSIEPCKYSHGDDSNSQENVEASGSNLPNCKSPILTSDSLETDASTHKIELVVSTPAKNSPKHILNISLNCLEQGNACNIQDNENRELDYIPLCLSPSNNCGQSKSYTVQLTDKHNSSRNIETESKKNDFESTSEINSKANDFEPHSELQSKGYEQKTITPEIILQHPELEPKHIFVSKETKLESTATQHESVSCQLESANTNLSHQLKSDSDNSKLLNTENKLQSELLSINKETLSPTLKNRHSELDSRAKASHLQSECSEIVNTRPDSSSFEISSKVGEVEPDNSELESNDCGLGSSNIELNKECALNELKDNVPISCIIDSKSSISVSESCDSGGCESIPEEQKRVPPIKLNLSKSSISSHSESKLEAENSSFIINNATQEQSDITKQVPKLTIKLKHPEEPKSPVRKLTIKPLRHPIEQEEEQKVDSIQQKRSMTKLNIKPILKPVENVNDKQISSQLESDNKEAEQRSDQLPFVTKLNIKQITKPPEKINDIHRKSSSSEISESEYSETDETTSTSDQTSASDNGSSEVVPKVTIKLGKPGTESEGKFYTEKNVPKLTIKGIQQDEKVIISQSEDIQPEKVPKLTIKTITKTESQPLSPKLTIKPIKRPESPNTESDIPKMKISTESYSSAEGKEAFHVPKFTIKAVSRMECDAKTTKKSSATSDSPELIPVVTKLNIKPILKPIDSEESSDDKVPVVSKLNIKMLMKPKDNDIDSSIDDVPKITKLNIKPLKNPEENSSEHFKDCDDLNADIDINSIPVVTKINIKPIIKPQEEEKEKYSEILSSETGNSSDDNIDHIPVVTKLNIKPIVKPDEIPDSTKLVVSCEQNIPIVTKLNIKPLLKPGQSSPLSPKKEPLKLDTHNTSIPVITKLNIKPIVRPEDADAGLKCKDFHEDKSVKNPPLVMKINMKSVTENFNHEHCENENITKRVSDESLSIKALPKMSNLSNEEKVTDNKDYKSSECETFKGKPEQRSFDNCLTEQSLKQNCVPDIIQRTVDCDEKMVVSKKAILRPFTKSKCDALTPQHSPKLPVNASCDPVLIESSRHDSMKIKESKIAPQSDSHKIRDHENDNFRSLEITEGNIKPLNQPKISSVQNCTLLKKLLENTRDTLDKKLEMNKVLNCTLPSDRSESTLSACKNIQHLVETEKCNSENTTSKSPGDTVGGSVKDKLEISVSSEKLNDLTISESNKFLQQIKEKVNENVTKPLEIVVADKINNQDSGQDSPRIILKINKTDHGPAAKIITEDIKRPDTLHNYAENTQDNLNDKLSPKKHIANSRRKQTSDTPIPPLNLSAGKRLRSSRIVEVTEKSQMKKNIGKRSSPPEHSPPQNKESELSTFQTKKLKLGQLLSESNALSESPAQPTQISPTLEAKVLESRPVVKTVNHSLLNSENCSKNGNSKLHNILSNLQAKQMHSLGLINSNCSEKSSSVSSNIEYDASISSSDIVEIPHIENSHPQLQHMIINENADFRELPVPEDTSQDPLEVESLKPTEVIPSKIEIPKPVELTPQPKKRGRPRKIPLSEGAKPAVVTLPVLALEERPQRSLRLMRDRPAVLHKPRGRGRGRGSRRVAESQSPVEPEPSAMVNIDQADVTPSGEIDPMSSRIKLPRMTEALDKMPSVCVTPLSSRRRNSSENFSASETSELKVLLENTSQNDFPNTPEPTGLGRGRGGRGSRGGRGRTPRGRGRGRGGGRGAMYMKETMGIYGRVCGPATTTVQLFEEETCMMDDNATPANSRPSHLLDDDSQSSVKSSTNDSNKMKKSKFADLFDSNKVWTAADVKEYTWPPPDKSNAEPTVMMIQEQVAMFLGVKSFKRRYPELKRRAIVGEERGYLMSKGHVTEALCDLGITAVDASDVLDVMLSDYPHKYEEFRSHQRERQLTEAPGEIVEEPKHEEKVKLEVKLEKNVEQKPELSKIDLEKTRQDMAAAAIRSANEWNMRLNAARRTACVDLQSHTVLRPRAPPSAPARPHLRPPAGFYPHALLPGQYQHSYRLYTPEQLRYFPLNTVLAAPPAPASATESSSDSEPEWGSRFSSSDDSDVPTHHSAKRKKLSKVKRASQVEATTTVIKEEQRDEVVDTCHACKLRLEANRKYTHERFLVCANCNAKFHPACLDLSADTIRKCRDYPWQCPNCKTCCSCRLPADDDKMLFCDLCDRGFHIYCVGLDNVPGGRWHCVECAICKSCGARSPGGMEATPGGSAGLMPSAPPADWHHQTKRGPGGHKVYSHSLCTPCARAYRIGRYCPLCERSFIGPKGTMQLVICKLCDRQLHQECVKQSGGAVRVMDYTCADCRRGGITSRAAAVRLAPRTIATLFMAKRRFNKYAHRQYMESRLRAGAPDPPDHSTDLSADAPDLSADAPDLSADAPDLSADVPDLSADTPDLSADAPE